MALSCGTVIYRRPCRKKPRHYTKCDLARIAKKAAEWEQNADLMVSVAIALGYPVIIDAKGLLDDKEYAEDLHNSLKDYVEFYGGVKLGQAISKGAIGVYRFVMQKVITYMLLHHLKQLAIALAPAIILSLRKHTIVGFPCHTLLTSNED